MTMPVPGKIASNFPVLVAGPGHRSVAPLGAAPPCAGATLRGRADSGGQSSWGGPFGGLYGISWVYLRKSWGNLTFDLFGHGNF